MPSTDNIDAIRKLGFVDVAGPLFDELSDVVLFVKDAEARYVTVNQTLVRRCGVDDKAALIGKTAREVFPGPMAESYYEQDQEVLRGTTLRDLLELHLYVQGAPGWCLTTKLPLLDNDGGVIGIVGVSNDIHAPAAQESGYRELAEVITHIRTHFGEPLRVDALAEMSGLSTYQFEQRMKKVFQLTPGQFISKTRIENACCELLNADLSIADVALKCGFSDQSAFTRQFKTTTGLTPTDYRRTQQP